MDGPSGRRQSTLQIALRSISQRSDFAGAFRHAQVIKLAVRMASASWPGSRTSLDIEGTLKLGGTQKPFGITALNLFRQLKENDFKNIYF